MVGVISVAVMAIYHFSAKVIGRGAGSSAVASAAYRSASRLHDERLDRHHDFSNKAGVVHSEVMLPDGAPEQLRDRRRYGTRSRRRRSGRTRSSRAKSSSLFRAS